jgi:hypothetical protein
MQLLISNIFVLLLILVVSNSVYTIHQYYKLRLTHNRNRRQRRSIEMILSCTESDRRKYNNKCETYMSISSIISVI